MDNDIDILIYQAEDGTTKIDVRLENETVWMTQKAIAELYQTTPQNIALHIKNIYEEELLEDATCKNYLQVQNEGKKNEVTGEFKGGFAVKNNVEVQLGDDRNDL